MNINYEKVQDSVKLKSYYSLSQIGLSNPSSMNEIKNALSNRSIFLDSDSEDTGLTGLLPSSRTLLFILKFSDSRCRIFAFGKTESDGDYLMYLDSLTNDCTETWVKMSIT